MRHPAQNVFYNFAVKNWLPNFVTLGESMTFNLR